MVKQYCYHVYCSQLCQIVQCFFTLSSQYFHFVTRLWTILQAVMAKLGDVYVDLSCDIFQPEREKIHIHENLTLFSHTMHWVKIFFEDNAGRELNVGGCEQCI